MAHSLNQINARIAKDVSTFMELVRGEGYHYLVLDDGVSVFETKSIMVPYTKDQDMSQWIADAKEYLAECQAKSAPEPDPAPVANEKPAKTPKATRVDRHINDDSSITVYIKGVKVRKFGGDENEEASEEEMEDVDAFIEKWLGRKFPKKTGGWVYGRTTQGHNWHTKRAKILRARIAELEAAGQDTTEVTAQLAKITGKA